MNINEMHFIREVLVQDYRGNLIPTMEASSSNASCLHPVFKEVAFYEHSAVSALYRELGGGRNEGMRVGSTVIIPNRSRWASLWRISPAEVQVIANPALIELSAEANGSRQDRVKLVIELA